MANEITYTYQTKYPNTSYPWQVPHFNNASSVYQLWDWMIMGPAPKPIKLGEPALRQLPTYENCTLLMARVKTINVSVTYYMQVVSGGIVFTQSGTVSGTVAFLDFAQPITYVEQMEAYKVASLSGSVPIQWVNPSTGNSGQNPGTVSFKMEVPVDLLLIPMEIFPLVAIGDSGNNLVNGQYYDLAKVTVSGSIGGALQNYQNLSSSLASKGSGTYTDFQGSASINLLSNPSFNLSATATISAASYWY